MGPAVLNERVRGRGRLLFNWKIPRGVHLSATHNHKYLADA